MHRPDAIAEIAEGSREPVSLKVAAGSKQLPIVRAFVESALYVDDWALDEVIDVNVVVDEICAQMIPGAVDDSTVKVTLTTGPKGLVGRVDGEIEADAQLDPAGFGWHVVQTMTDGLAVDYRENSAGRLVSVRFGKYRT